MNALELRVRSLEAPPSSDIVPDCLDLIHIGIVSEKVYRALCFTSSPDKFLWATIAFEEQSITRTMRIFPSSDLLIEPLTVLVGPFLPFSLCPDNKALVTPKTSPPETASSLVLSGENLPISFQRRLLKGLFSCPRPVHAGESLGIPIWGFPLYFNEREQGKAVFNERDYDEEPGIFLSPERWPGAHRHLQREKNEKFGSVFSEFFWFKVESVDGCIVNLFDTKISVKLSKGFQEICGNLQSYIFENQHISTTVFLRPCLLLTGAQKSGKRALLRLAAGSKKILEFTPSSYPPILAGFEEWVDKICRSLTNENHPIVLIRRVDSFFFEEPNTNDSVLSGLLRHLSDKGCIVVGSATDSTKIGMQTSEFFNKRTTLDKLDFSYSHTFEQAKAISLISGETVETENRKLSKRQSSMENSAERVQWDEIGGLEDAKREINELLKCGKRKGLVLFGVPGSGKSLLAKAIATELAGEGKPGNFFSVKGPELLSSFIGESESNIRQVFSKANSARPCVIFFDEIDSIAPQRGKGSDSALVMDRVVASLLSELDSLNDDVFVIGATNRPDLLDHALIRPGRLDRMVFVGVSDDKLGLVKALAKESAKTENRKFVISCDLEKVADTIPHNFTGADVAGVLRNAQFCSISKKAAEIESIAIITGLTLNLLQYLLTESENIKDYSGHHFQLTCGCSSTVGSFICGTARILQCRSCKSYFIQNNDDCPVRISSPFELLDTSISFEDIQDTIKDTVPSVTEEDIKHYHTLRNQFSHRRI